MRWPLISAAAVAAAAVLTATGCAGAGASGSSSLGGAAALVPADARVFVALDSDLSSAQWRGVDGLLAAFLPRHALLAARPRWLARSRPRRRGGGVRRAT